MNDAARTGMEPGPCVLRKERGRLKPCAPQPVEAAISLVGEVVEHGVLTPLPEETCRSQGRDSQQTDTEDANDSSRVRVHAH